ncbi:TPA: RNA 2',3'-cyclic phosphodiesterase [Candidatus Bathyarchaeota archaeon]|nr:RNA 2',3'-cyclic phosphodiesterase [Candidatus Bathyarchaeota archaeon]HIJ08400.1 RNA 2',3'-cyclic phosphodiesterase [Candidatus Bathyarchaeota archaeon]
MSESIRSFLAFDIESDQVKEELARVQMLLVQTGADLKLVETENIHITIRFLGNITPNMIDRIYDKMKTVQFNPFNIQIKGIGAFPNINYPRVVWAGIAEGANQLRDVFSQLEAKLSQLGLPPDPKGFTAHLTIARVKSGRNKMQLAEFLADKANYEFGSIKGDCLRLKQSDLTPKGPVYSTLREFCPSS